MGSTLTITQLIEKLQVSIKLGTHKDSLVYFTLAEEDEGNLANFIPIGGVTSPAIVLLQEDRVPVREPVTLQFISPERYPV